MVEISFVFLTSFITVLWLLIRIVVWARQRRVDWKREAQLLLVYVCIMVITRVTFFPFAKVDGAVQPLLFDVTRIFPPRINLIPMVHLLDYPNLRDILLNVIGNTTMFIPVGIVWPVVYQKLDRHWKVIAAGVGYPLCIEILQLPFYDRVSDVDDLILNSVGFLMGYGIYLLVRKCKHRK